MSYYAAHNHVFNKINQLRIQLRNSYMYCLSKSSQSCNADKNQINSNHIIQYLWVNQNQNARSKCNNGINIRMKMHSVVLSSDGVQPSLAWSVLNQQVLNL